MTKQSWLLVLLFLTLNSNLSTACSCMPLHPQLHYCNSNFVIRGTPVSIMEAEREVIYRIENIEILRVDDELQPLFENDYIEIHTSNSEASCGIRLNLDQEYVLAGSEYQSQLYINMCQIYSRWTSLTEFQREGFTSLYNEGCSCDIVRYSDDDQIEENPDVCLLNINALGCYHQYSACLRNNDSCEFLRTTDLLDCLGTD